MAFNGRFIVNLARFAAKQGGDVDGLFALSEKTEAQLCDENCVLDNEVYNAVIEAAVRMSGDRFFGLHAGENLNLAAAGLIGQITQTSETVKQALEFCCEFANLGCSALPMALTEEKDHYKVIITPDELWRKQSSVAFRHTAEGVLAFTIKEFHALTQMQHNPIAIHLPWQRPDDITEYERVFDCAVLFNKTELSILLNKKYVEEKVITSDFDLLRILVAHAEEKSTKISQERGFTALVKESIVNLLKPKFPNIKQVASHLNISSRSLQRRLKEENCTYKELVEDLRKDFAFVYLKRSDLNIGEVAYLLSYADISTFSRSFKRWTGKSPRAYRQQVAAGDEI